MNFYKAFKLGRVFLAGRMLVIGGCIVIIIITTQRIREELDYHARYGSDWVRKYEEAHGSLAHANVKIALGIAYLVALVAFLIWVYLRNRPKHTRRSKSRHRR